MIKRYKVLKFHTSYLKNIKITLMYYQYNKIIVEIFYSLALTYLS